MAQLERLVLIEPDKSINLMLFEYIDLPKLREVKLKFKESFLASIPVGKQLRIQYVTIELSVVIFVLISEITLNKQLPLNLRLTWIPSKTFDWCCQI